MVMCYVLVARCSIESKNFEVDMSTTIQHVSVSYTIDSTVIQFVLMKDQ